MSEFIDDLRQTYIMAKHETLKFVRGKTAMISFMILLLVVIAVIILLNVRANLSLSVEDYLQTFTLFGTSAIVVLVTLISSGIFSSEYETKTGLFLFTKPIKIESIFAGKVLASLAFTIFMVIVYYIMVSLATLIFNGQIYDKILTVVGIVIAYAVGTTGVALLFSSIFKKSSISAVITFVTLLVGGQIIQEIAATSNLELWYMLSYAVTSTTTVIYGSQSYLLNTSTGIENYFFADPLLSTLVMISWGIFSILLSYLFFIRREF